ncbi:Uncharacterized protein FWK35_00029754 [Aphis craccivora]|uniref:FLYWCH-type domain-containing protein n=1 Tax=Aphis craccivora TaxID=307492 RepID=A0A6G0YTQ5_APHCR|nr:Uncharacterized protein FWK35_00029754 [Aphis craccivora]
MNITKKAKSYFHTTNICIDLHRSNGNKCIWRCVEFINYKCKGRCHPTNDEESGEIIKIPTYSHPPNADKINVKEGIDKLKNEAKTSCEPTINVVSKIVSDVSKITVTVRRTRNKYNYYPTNPINITDLILPDQYKVTKTGVPFLLHDIKKEGKRSLIFTTENNLGKSDVWMADGTFKSVPPLFSQLYTIHACKKKSATYPLEINLKPSMLMVDFEIAFISTC